MKLEYIKPAWREIKLLEFIQEAYSLRDETQEGHRLQNKNGSTIGGESVSPEFGHGRLRDFYFREEE